MRWTWLSHGWSPWSRRESMSGVHRSRERQLLKTKASSCSGQTVHKEASTLILLLLVIAVFSVTCWLCTDRTLGGFKCQNCNAPSPTIVWSTASVPSHSFPKIRWIAFLGLGSWTRPHLRVGAQARTKARAFTGDLESELVLLISFAENRVYCTSSFDYPLSVNTRVYMRHC